MKPSQIRILPKKEYEVLYHTSFEIPADISRDDLEHEWEELGEKLRTALGEHWAEDCCGDEDFAISDDWAAAFHHCGGIYSDEIICPLYPDIIAKVLSTMRHKNRWTFHTVIEPESNNFPCGEFFIRGLTLYAPENDGFDYVNVFGQQKKTSRQADHRDRNVGAKSKEPLRVKTLLDLYRHKLDAVEKKIISLRPEVIVEEKKLIASLEGENPNDEVVLEIANDLYVFRNAGSGKVIGEFSIGL